MKSAQKNRRAKAAFRLMRKMSKELINQTLSIGIPEGFHVMDAQELKQAFQSDHPDRWGIRNRESHVMVTVLWKDYPILLSKLADLKAVCRKNEQMAAKGYAGHDYQCGGFFSLTAAGLPAEGYRFSYSVDGVEQSAETILFKLEKTIFTITCGGRRENREADRELFDRIIAGITLE